MSSRSKGTKRARSGDKTPETRSRRRLDYAALPLQGKSFFLHIQSAGKARELEKKIKELGGVIEKFLSKELSCVVTDQPIASTRSTAQGKQTTNLALSGLRGQTRAQAMLQKSQQKQSAKSTDVLTNAEKWGIQVKPVQQVLKWIDMQKKRPASAQPTGRVCSLRGAFLKVEDHSRNYKPLVKELKVWPRLNLDAPPGFSPFDEPISMRTRSRSSSKSPRRGGKRQTKQQPTESTADKKGYCELCDAHYVGMEKHVASRQHKLVASQKGTYAELDRLISRGKSLKEFEDEVMRKRTAAESKTTRVTRSQTRSRSPVAAKSTPKENQKTPTQSATPRRTTPRSKSPRQTFPRSKSPRRTTPRSSTPRRTSPRSKSPRRTTPRSSSPRLTSPRRQPRTPSPSSRRTSSSSRKAQQKVTPIKLVRFQENQYSVVKSTSKKRRRNEMEDAGPSRSKRKKTDRYSIVESTPMRIRLRRSRRNGSSTGRGSMFVNVPMYVKNPKGRSP